MQPSSLQYWSRKLEGTGTTTVDSCGFGSTGTLTNTPTWATGPTLNIVGGSGALTFASGSTQYVTCGTGPKEGISAGSISIAFWWNGSSPGQNKTFLSRRLAGTIDSLNYGIFTSNDAAPFLSFLYTIGNVSAYHDWETTSTMSSLGLLDGSWHHIAFTFTYGSGTMTCYVDGTSKSGSWTFGDGTASYSNQGTEVLTTGGTWTSSGPTNLITGTIGEQRIYNVLLNSTQVGNLAAGNHEDGSTFYANPSCGFF